MERHSKPTRFRVRVISFSLAGVLALAGLAVYSQTQAAQYRYLLNKTYEHAFAELTASVSGLNTALQKGRYATSGSLFSSLCAEAFHKSQAAQTALGALPYGNVELEQTAAFLAKTGDYMMALSRVGPELLTQAQWDALEDLSHRTDRLCQTLQALQADLYAGTVTLENLSQAETRLSQAAEDGGTTPAGSSFQTVESEFPELPALIYDGPFSDHIANRAPRMLQECEVVSQDQARDIAASFLDLPPTVFTLVSQGGEQMPTYGFSAQVNGGEVYMEVTQQGGRVLCVLTSRPAGEASLSQEQAADKAKSFLRQRGYPDLTETYFIDQGHVLTVNFAALQGDVLCYPDLIKVSISLDNGDVVGFDARNYLMNHQQRTLPAPAVSQAEAAARVPDCLEVLSRRLAVIPTSGENEVFCHEFKCQDGEGRHCLIYVNAQTGQQERILLLLEDSSGTLVL